MIVIPGSSRSVKFLPSHQKNHPQKAEILDYVEDQPTYIHDGMWILEIHGFLSLFFAYLPPGQVRFGPDVEWLPQEILPGLDVDEVPLAASRIWGWASTPPEAAYGPQQAAAYEVDTKKSEAFYSEAVVFVHVGVESHDKKCCQKQLLI